MNTTIKFLDADLVNDITYLMVDIRMIEMPSRDYRTLVGYSKSWRSGLEKRGTTFKLMDKNAIGMEGRAIMSNIEKILKRYE